MLKEYVRLCICNRTSERLGCGTQYLSPVSPPGRCHIPCCQTSSALHPLVLLQPLSFPDEEKEEKRIKSTVFSSSNNQSNCCSLTLSSLAFVPRASLNPGRSALGLAWPRPPGPAPRCCRPGDSFLCCFTALLGRFTATGFLDTHTHIIEGHNCRQKHLKSFSMGR